MLGEEKSVELFDITFTQNSKAIWYRHLHPFVQKLSNYSQCIVLVSGQKKDIYC